MVHVSDVANILKSRTTREDSWRILSALVSMRGVSLIGVNEAYSFDKHFDQLPEIKRITS